MNDVRLTRRLALALIAVLALSAAAWLLLWQTVRISYDTGIFRAAYADFFFPAKNDPLERIEQLFYVLFCAAVALVALASALADRPLQRIERAMPPWLDYAGAAGIVVLFLAIDWMDVSTSQVRETVPPYGSVPRAGFTLLNPVTWALMAVAALALWRSRAGLRTTGRLIALGVALFVASFTLVANRDGIVYSYHLEPLLHAIVQVTQGAGITVNTRSLYGLFPHFLEPYFAVAGVSLFSFSLLYSATTATFIAACYGLLERTAPSLALRLVSLLGLVYVAYFVNPRWPEDPYPQFFFVRLVFPALLILLVVFTGRLSRLARPWLAFWSGVFALGLWWNVESGVAALGAFLACHAVSIISARTSWAAFRRKAFGDAGAALAGILASAALFCGYMRLRYGSPPDLAEVFRYASLSSSYGPGFGTARIEGFLTPVIFVAAAFAGTVVLSLLQAVRRNVGKADEARLVAACLGLGLLIYWTGRSNMELLVSCAGPFVVVILSSLVSSWQRQGRGARRNPLFTASAGLAALFLCFGFAGFFVELRSAQQFQYPQGRMAGETVWEKQAARLAETVAAHPGPVLVMSPISWFFYDAAGKRQPLSGSGYRHDIWKDDFRDRLAYIRSGAAAVIVLHVNANDYYRFQFADDGELKRIEEALSARYRLAGRVDPDPAEDFRIYLRR